MDFQRGVQAYLWGFADGDDGGVAEGTENDPVIGSILPGSTLLSGEWEESAGRCAEASERRETHMVA